MAGGPEQRRAGCLLCARALNDKAGDFPDTKDVALAEAVIHAVPDELGVGAGAA
jgi:hypothetical protein